MPLLEGLVGALLEHETSPLRFEALCLDLLGLQENAVFVPTSRTWDLGRDGRRVLQTESSHHVVCASLAQTLDAKVTADIERLEATTRPRSIVYCTSRELSEHTADILAAEIRKLSPSVQSVQVLYQMQLATMALTHESILRKHYQAELSNLESLFFGVSTPDVEAEKTGLRLALLTQTGDDAQALRDALARRLILEQLSAKGPQTQNAVLVSISGQLHLPRTISSAYGTSVVELLQTEGLIENRTGRLEVTAAGTAWLATLPSDAAPKLLEGKKLIHAALAKLTGFQLTPEEYDRVWDTFQDGIAQLFFVHGTATIRMVAAIESGRRVEDGEAALAIREKLAHRIGAMFGGLEKREAMQQAIIDLFSEKGTAAFDWLSEICAVYVMMCSLGLEPQSSASVTSVVRGITLLLDTDVILSLLSDGEVSHKETEQLLGGWRALGGTVLAPDPSLEEAAYHAWIAESDYVATSSYLPQLSDLEAEHVISNAFVRGFRAVSRGRLDRKTWERYIGQYRGSRPHDYSRVLAVLRDEYRVDRLPGFGSEIDKSTDSFYVSVLQFMITTLAAEMECESDDLDFRIRDKARRDALMLASLRAARAAFREQGRDGTLMAVSSARLIKMSDERFRTDLGDPDAVLSLGAVGTLLALTPGVHFGLGSLRGILFDLNLAKRLTGLQRYAYRIVAQSEQYDVPWSRRTTLKRELGERILRDAKASDRPVEEIARIVTKADDPEYSAQIVRDALDAMAVPTRREKENTALRREIEQLQRALAAERERKASV
ncbi:MAG: hypothetical protein IPJ78_19470 [Gemmatimonadetes bacterium]|nr:hypothetical protein [Gemmatimonadota bacterium]